MPEGTKVGLHGIVVGVQDALSIETYEFVYGQVYQIYHMHVKTWLVRRPKRKNVIQCFVCKNKNKIDNIIYIYYTSNRNFYP